MDARRLAPILPVLVLLAACNPASNRSDAQSDPAALQVEPGLMNRVGASDGAGDPAEAEARARTALAELLPDAATAPLRNVRSEVGRAVCGEIERDDGSRGFVVPPDGPAVIARSEELRLDDLDDPYPALYIRWCASSDELIALQSELPALTPTADPGPPDADLMASDIPPPVLPEARREPAPARPPAAEPGETRRFSDAVLRPDER